MEWMLTDDERTPHEAAIFLVLCGWPEENRA